MPDVALQSIEYQISNNYNEIHPSQNWIIENWTNLPQTIYLNPRKQTRSIELWLLTWWNSENLANKSSGIDQSKMSKFSLILDSEVLFGSILWPFCSPQRRATCAGVLPSLSAIALRIGFWRTSPPLKSEAVPNEPNGEYPKNWVKFRLYLYITKSLRKKNIQVFSTHT